MIITEDDINKKSEILTAVNLGPKRLSQLILNSEHKIHKIKKNITTGYQRK